MGLCAERSAGAGRGAARRSSRRAAPTCRSTRRYPASGWPSCWRTTAAPRGAHPGAACAAEPAGRPRPPVAASSTAWRIASDRPEIRRAAGRADGLGEPRLRDLHLRLDRPPKGVAVAHRGARASLARGAATSTASAPADRRAPVAAGRLRRLGLGDLRGRCCRAAALVPAAGEPPRSPGWRGLSPRERRDDARRHRRPRRSRRCCAEGAPAGCRRCAGCVAGGEVLSPRSVRAGAGRSARRARLINLYGPTENTTVATLLAVRDRRRTAPPVPIGRPIADTRALPARRGAAAGAGRACRASSTSGGAAWRAATWPAELTAERFVPDPFGAEPGARLYRTGDLARCAARTATLEFLGRARPPGQDPRLPHRAGRDRGGAAAATRRCARPWCWPARTRPGDRRLVAYVVPARCAGRRCRSCARSLARSACPSTWCPRLRASSTRCR